MLPKLRVGLSPVWGGMFLLVAVLDLVVWTMTHASMQLVFAVIMGVVGITHLTGALLVVDDRTIELKNPLGMTLKTFVVDSADDLQIEGRKLWIRQGADKKKISGLMANGTHWKQLADAVSALHSARG
ncbi:MAG: hypothetical protein QM831_46380 [Kofleriaceae bacterium]